MLSMKTLRVAIVTMGSALLLGPGLAMAQTEHRLDGMEPTAALVYAQETLAAADPMGRMQLELPASTAVVVSPRRALEGGEDVYLRIDLAGAQFGAGTQPSLVSGETGNLSTNGTLSSGGMDSSFAVFKLGATRVEATGLIGVQIVDQTAEPSDLQLTATSGNVTATISAYSDPDDALDEVGARGTFAGSGTVIRLVSGLNVTIKAADDPVASVATGFLRFAGGAGTARLGWLGIEEKLTDAEAMPSGVLSAATGLQLEQGGVIAGAPGTPDDQGVATYDYTGSATFSVMGNLDIGAFNVAAETFDVAGMPDGECVGGAEDVIDRGGLFDAESMRLIGEEGELPAGVDSAMTMALPPDIYLLCVNVDVTGPMSNMAAIPKADYSAGAYVKLDGGDSTPSNMVGEGDLASIGRDGASVEIPYLTTSEKHNQRIIVVNRGTRAVPITGITFTAEGGVDVELTDAVQAGLETGILEVPAQSSWVAPSSDVISFTSEGARRTAATINFFGTKESLSVATTQVNISDGSTDTVVYDVK